MKFKKQAKLNNVRLNQCFSPYFSLSSPRGIYLAIFFFPNVPTSNEILVPQIHCISVHIFWLVGAPQTSVMSKLLLGFICLTPNQESILTPLRQYYLH